MHPVRWQLTTLLTFALTACVAQPHEADLGSVSLALTSQTGGITYRLTDARFALAGPEDKGFTSGEEETLSMELPPGAYTLELLDGWKLVRADDPEGQPVTATLLSENPAPLLVEAATTTAVALRFELRGGAQLSNELGTLSVSLELGVATSGAGDGCREGLRINEVDYDQPSTDEGEFIEIVNTASCDASLDGVTLELVNAGDGEAYGRMQLSEAGAQLAAGGRLVVGDPGVLAALPSGVLSLGLPAAGLQNGPDGLRLVHGERQLDGVAYEGSVPETGEGGFTDADEQELTLSRCPDAFDSQDNALDFALRAPTPGAANACER
jgi:hypothetical protein